MTRLFKGCISNLDYMGFPDRLMRIMVSVFTENINFLGGVSEHRTLENPPRQVNKQERLQTEQCMGVCMDV